MIPAGYMAKYVANRPDWLKADRVIDIYSVSNCVSNDFADYIRLEVLLNDARVACHPFIIGELACGNLKNRNEILSLLQALPTATIADNEEVMEFIENYHLMGKGLGYIDMHLLTSAILSKLPLWTLDKRLQEISSEMGLDFRH